jgi:hypothetical protein
MLHWMEQQAKPGTCRQQHSLEHPAGSTWHVILYLVEDQ